MKTISLQLNELCGTGVSAPDYKVQSNVITINFAPSADAVAQRVCKNYGTRCVVPGDELRHWLEAELELAREAVKPARARATRGAGYRR